ncbi:MAG: thioredoxin domain-containing protein [Candidatus Aminicenantales bacterium]|jgi:uncharacterized protein YyaL (SSP411 family)
MNRLSREKSPYLRQHAGNPVDWYPWGDEAFERARLEDKPVFLSIGYSTCHWCHVMERESFADEEVARLLNGTFVCVKVDREERPDLDDYFMSVGQALTGAGGWPLTVVITPDQRPFFAGTYFPKERRWGRPGLMELIPRIGEAWRTRRDEILRSADGIIEAVRGARSRAAGQASGRPERAPQVFDRAFHDLEADFDAKCGGFGSAPKFPAPHHLEFLLRYRRRTGNATALAMAEGTLQAMRRGGIWDHLGFGFHRYSTDAVWLVPHFEKMLYDQALLAEVYAEAFLATGKPEYKGTAAETLQYVLRDLTSPEGGFYSAEDADSEGEEGRFYVWTDEEVRQALDDQEARLAIDVFNVRPEGNFAEPGGRPDGRNILHLDRTGGSGNPLKAIRHELFLARKKRIRPFKDMKILADWNGLAIGALARAARAIGEARFLKTADGAARFVLERMRGPGGRLFHAFMEGEASVPAFLDDYAFFIRGLIELYQAGFDPGYLESALELAGTALADFADREDGGFFAVPAGSELPVRMKSFYDGALPSGNSVMLMNLLRLARLTGRRDMEEAAGRVAADFADQAGLDPRAHTGFLSGLDYAFGPATEIVVVGRADDDGTKALLASVNRAYLPNAVVLFKPAGKGASRIEKLAPFTKDMREVDGASAAYVCTGGRCLKPVTTAEGLDRILRTGGA